MDTSRCKVWRQRLPDPVGHMNSSDRQEYVVVRAGQSDICVTLHTWIGEMQEMQEWERHSRIQLCHWDWVQRSLLVILHAEIRCGAMPPPPPPPPPLPSPPSFSPSAFLDSNESAGFVSIIPSMSASCPVVTPPKEVRRSPASFATPSLASPWPTYIPHSSHMSVLSNGSLYCLLQGILVFLSPLIIICILEMPPSHKYRSQPSSWWIALQHSQQDSIL